MRTHARGVACIGAILTLSLVGCGGNFDFERTIATATAARAALAPTATAGNVATSTTASGTGTETRVSLRMGTPAPSLITATPDGDTVRGTATGRVTAAPTNTRTAAMTGTITVTTGTPTGTRIATTTAGTRAATTTVTGMTTTTTTTTRVVGTAPRDTLAFTDPGGRFTFFRPRVWREGSSTNRDIAVQYASNMPAGRFNVLASDVPASVTLDQYVDANLATIKRDIAGYRDGPIGSQRGNLGGTPARQYDYFATLGGEEQYVVQIYCVRAEVAYVLTFATPVDAMNPNMDAFNDAAQVVVNSWRFL